MSSGEILAVTAVSGFTPDELAKKVTIARAQLIRDNPAAKWLRYWTDDNILPGKTIVRIDALTDKRPSVGCATRYEEINHIQPDKA